MRFEFSDTISGYVKKVNPEDKNLFSMTTSDGREFDVKLTDNTFGRLMRNLGEPYFDCTGQMRDMLMPGQYLSTYGVFYPKKDSHVFEAKVIDFPDKKPAEYRFEEEDWWIKQAKSICDFFITSQFGEEKKY